MTAFFRNIIFLFVFAAGLSSKVFADENASAPVDVIICMDLSSSSNGLIDHLRNHLWDFWYFFSRCTPHPNFRIGVVTYARFSYGKQNGYSRVVRDLGTDFEKLSSTLFKIPSRIEKGDQYVGAALNLCLKKISWSKDPSAKKIIILVGNGDVTTGRTDIDEVVNKISSQGIIVNTVYCTVPGERKAIKGWERIAQAGRGRIFTMSIRNRYFDRLNGFDMPRFRALNRKFNNTYLYYGPGGRARWKLLQEEDNHVYITNTEGYRFRSLYKISQDYLGKNDQWDLVDQYSNDPEAFLKADKKLLNDTCKKMSDEQLKEYINYKKYERKKIAALIAEMITDKELKDREDGIIIPRNMPTLDIISLRMLRDILKPSGWMCTAN